jgi:hypothetical protein
MTDSRPNGAWWRRLVGVAAVACCAQTSPALAQSATAPILTAAFLFNFAKFTEWPRDALAPGQELMFCVVGDNAVREALERTVEGHAIDSHQLTVRIVKPDGSPSGCHLLYVAGSEGARAGLLLASAKGSAMLTVSDAEHFAQTGGIAQLVRERDRMRFTVNLGAARHARLTLSSRLLSLANVIQE